MESPVLRRDKIAAKAKLLKARIRCHIKSFLAQHTLFPVQFRYGGVDQLTALKITNTDGRAETNMSGESRIINLRLGGGSRTSQRSGRSSSVGKKHKRNKSALGKSIKSASASKAGLKPTKKSKSKKKRTQSK